MCAQIDECIAVTGSDGRGALPSVDFHGFPF
jgi:hypothetical protein